MSPSLRSRRVGSRRGSDVRFGQHDPHRPAVRVDDLAVADLVVHPAEGMDADGVVADAPFRLLGHLDLGDQAARRRIPSRELDAGRLADQAASSVAPDEVLRPQRPAVGQLDVDAGLVLREARHLASAIDRHRQLADPAGQDALDVVLPQPERVGMPGGKVADVQRDAGELPDLDHLPLREEPIGDAALIEDLDGARVQTACARAGRSWLGRRSTMATSTPASASSPASISPVGPPPAITTACSVIRASRSSSDLSSLRGIQRAWWPVPSQSGHGTRLPQRTCPATASTLLGPAPPHRSHTSRICRLGSPTIGRL